MLDQNMQIKDGKMLLPLIMEVHGAERLGRVFQFWMGELARPHGNSALPSLFRLRRSLPLRRVLNQFEQVAGRDAQGSADRGDC